MKLTASLIALASARKQFGIKPNADTQRDENTVVENCGGTITAGDTVITSPGFGNPGYYYNNLNCEWTINIPGESDISIIPEHFDIERNSVCAYDALNIHEGNSITTTYCGTHEFNRKRRQAGQEKELRTSPMIERHVVQNGDRIEFTTDHSVVGVFGREAWRRNSAGARLAQVARISIGTETGDDAELESALDDAVVGRELDSVAVLNDVAFNHRACAKLLLLAGLSSFSVEFVSSTIRRGDRIALVNVQRIISANGIALDVEMFRNDGNVALTGNVDGPFAVQVVVVVARIAETGRRDDGVAGGDRAAAVLDNGVFISLRVGIRLDVELFPSGSKSNQRRGELH